MTTVRKPILIAVVLVALVAATAVSAADEKTAGVYKLYKLGETIGAERFTIRFASDDNYVAEGDISTRVDDRKSEVGVRLETQGREKRIKMFQKELKISEVTSVYAMIEKDGTYRIASQEGLVKRETTIRINPTAMLIEPGVIHHMIPLVRNYNLRKGGQQRIPVYLGTEEREIDATLTLTGGEPVTLSYGTFRAHRLFLNLGDVGLYLWVSPKGDLLRVEDPMRGHVAELLEYQGETAEPPAREPVPRREGLLYEETSFMSDGADLSAILTRPAEAKGPLPALIYISDDGPHDRDGVVPFIGVNIGTAEMMDAISAAGYAVLRYDDRGVAMSEGEYLTGTLSVLEKDVEAAIAFLKTRPEVDASRIGLIGRGAGGNLAIRIATRQPDVAAIVALAASSIPLDQLAVEQTKRRLEDSGNLNPDTLRRQPIIYILDQAKTTDQSWLVYSGKALYLDIFREYAKLTPLEDLAKLKKPVLVAWGDRDQQVFPEHGERLAEVCRSIEGETCTPVSYRNLDHFFKESRGNYGEAIDPSRRIDGRFLTKTIQWLDVNLAHRGGDGS